MTDPTDGDPLVSWASLGDRMFRSARNVVTFESTLERVMVGQKADRKLMVELDERVRKIEAQHEIILRPLERGGRA